MLKTYSDTISSLPFLEAFVREVLRLYTPIPQLNREATRDCVIPLATPVIGRDGCPIQQLVVPKGTNVFIGICHPRLSLQWSRTLILLSYRKSERFPIDLRLRCSSIPSRKVVIPAPPRAQRKIRTSPGSLGKPYDFWRRTEKLHWLSIRVT